jgi:hypothetical protein
MTAQAPRALLVSVGVSYCWKVATPFSSRCLTAERLQRLGRHPFCGLTGLSRAERIREGSVNLHRESSDKTRFPLTAERRAGSF